MKNKISIFLSSALFLSFFAVTLYSCKKDEVVTPNKEVALFVVSGPSATYRMTTPTTVYKIPVGLTRIPAGTRTVAVTVTTTTGAVVGTHYTINKTSFTFDQNKIADTMVITGVQAQYLSGRKDTLKFSFTNPTDGIPTLSNTFTLGLRGPCLEDDLQSGGFADLLGSYTKTYENGSYGPYTSTFTNATSVGSTTAKATLNNIYDNSISAVADFNYATTGSFTVSIAGQQTQYTVGGLPLFVRSAGTGTFTYCSQRFTIPMELYTSAGLYDAWTMTMAR